MKKIVLTGGGTAGHIMPNLALLPYLEKEFDKIYYLGAKDSMEERIIKQYNKVEFISIPTTKLIRKLTLKNLAIPFKLINGIFKTKKIIKQINPNVIFCKGGFVSVPVAIAGKKCKIPVISHESDLSMGLANKIILKFANVVCTTFEDTAKISRKCVCTGTPIRDQIFKGNKRNILNEFKTHNSQKSTILFFGGSLGSKNINSIVEKNVDMLLEKYNVIHITGKNNKNKIVKNGYFQKEFVDNIEDYFALSDIVICRGGANSLFELLALNKPMLIIPLSKAESRGDQIENAEYFKKNKFAEVLMEEELNINSLLFKLEYINKNFNIIVSNTKKANVKDANKKITGIIVKNAKNMQN